MPGGLLSRPNRQISPSTKSLPTMSKKSKFEVDEVNVKLKKKDEMSPGGCLVLVIILGLIAVNCGEDAKGASPAPPPATGAPR